MTMRGRFWMAWLAAATIAMGAAPAAAQVRTIDPNAAIDSDLGTPPAPTTTQDAPTATLSNTQSYPDPDAYPQVDPGSQATPNRSEEHTSELQSLMRISYAVFCLKKKTTTSAQQTKTK